MPWRRHSSRNGCMDTSRCWLMCWNHNITSRRLQDRCPKLGLVEDRPRLRRARGEKKNMKRTRGFVWAMRTCWDNQNKAMQQLQKSRPQFKPSAVISWHCQFAWHYISIPKRYSPKRGSPRDWSLGSGLMRHIGVQSTRYVEIESISRPTQNWKWRNLQKKNIPHDRTLSIVWGKLDKSKSNLYVE